MKDIELKYKFQVEDDTDLEELNKFLFNKINAAIKDYYEVVINKDYFKSMPMTDDMINDMIAGFPEEEQVAFLQEIFGVNWREHYQGK